MLRFSTPPLTSPLSLFRQSAPRTTTSLVCLFTFLGSQWLMPQIFTLQQAQADDRIRSQQIELRRKQVRAQWEKTARSAKMPIWYRTRRAQEAARSKAARESIEKLKAQALQAPSLKGPHLRLVHDGPHLEGGHTGGALLPGKESVSNGFAADGRRLNGHVRPSAKLYAPFPFTSTKEVSLDGGRVPTQTEICSMGALCGSLYPCAPAEANDYAESVDNQLRQEGFARGLETAMPDPDSEAALRLNPGLRAQARRLKEARQKVKEARDQNREFAQLMADWNWTRYKKAVQGLRQYVKKYPKGPWTPEALTRIADFAKFAGRPAEAQELYQQVMELTDGKPGSMEFESRQRAYERWTDLYIVEGRYAEARPMLEDILKNDLAWRRRTWANYWLGQITAFQTDKKRMLARRDCGTKALAMVLTELGQNEASRSVAKLRPSDDRGFSLAQLRQIAAQKGLPVQGFSATPTQLAKLPLPLILHYESERQFTPPALKTNKTKSLSPATKPAVVLANKQTQTKSLDKLPKPRGERDGHFMVVRAVDTKRGTVAMINPQDGMRVALTFPQLRREWSGRGLVIAGRPTFFTAQAPLLKPNAGRGVRWLSDSSPRRLAHRLEHVSFSHSDITLLTEVQMKTTRGTCYMNSAQDENGCNGNNTGLRGSSCGAGGGSGGGSPSASPGGKPSGSVGGGGTNGRVGGFGTFAATATGGNYGSPAISVNRVSQNIFVNDTPLWYQPAAGPAVEITLSYNSQDASNYNTVMGNKWSFNYGAHLLEAPESGGDAGRVTAFMPDGNQEAFYPTTAAGVYPRSYASPRGNFSTLTKTADKAFTLTFQGGDKALFGIPAGTSGNTPLLLELRDRFGQSLTFQYVTQNGQIVLATITDALGAKTRFGYDNSNHITYVQDPFERQASFAYDINGNLIECVDMEGNAFQYTYDDMVNLTCLNTAQGPWVFESKRYTSDLYGKTQLKVWNPLQAAPEVFLYDGTPVYSNGHDNTKNYSHTDNRGAITEYELTLLTDSTNPGKQIPVITRMKQLNGDVTALNFTDGRTLSPTSVNSPGGIVTGMTYNAQGKPTQITTTSAGATRQTNIVYEANGLDVDAVNVSGSEAGGANPRSLNLVTSASYNALGQPLWVTDGTNHRTNYTYTTWGALASVWDVEVRTGGNVTHTTSYTYDSSTKRLMSITRDGNTLVSFTYDPVGRVSSTTDSRGIVTSYFYNNLDKLVRVNHSDGTSEEVDYICCDLPGMTTDRSGKRTYYDYDALKRLIRVQDTDANTLQFDYDEGGNRTRMIDAKGQETRWRYDDMGRVVGKRYDDGQEESYAYVGPRLASSRNGRGQLTGFLYNAFNQVTGIDYEASSGTSDVTLTYDALGRLVTLADGTGTTQYGYDLASRLTREDGPWANDTVLSAYDGQGRLKDVDVMRDATTNDQSDFAYDVLGRLSSVSQSAGAWGSAGTWNYSYVGNTGVLAQVLNPNGTKTLYGYEGSGGSAAGTLGRMLSVSTQTSTGGNLFSFAYSYGNSALRDTRSGLTRSYGADSQSVAYSYTNSSMLTGETASASGALPAVSSNESYDSMGSPLVSKDLVANTRLEHNSNRLNQVVSQTKRAGLNNADPATLVNSFSYDGDGNMSGTSSTVIGTPNVTTSATYTYDGASRLTSITTPNQSKSEFVYDGMSRLRISRTFTWNSPTSSWIKTGEVRRVYSGMDVVQERSDQNAVTASYARVGNIGGILGRTDANGTLCYHYDGGGNVVGLTNASGAEAARYVYDAWGKVIASSGVAASLNSYRFSTKEALGGLYYYGYRFYSPALHKWLNRDPIRESGGTNLYAFVGGNPVNFQDDYGFQIGQIKNTIKDALVDPGEFVLESTCKRVFYLPEKGWSRKHPTYNMSVAGMGSGEADAIEFAGQWIKIPDDTTLFVQCDPCGNPYNFHFLSDNIGSILLRKPAPVDPLDPAFPPVLEYGPPSRITINDGPLPPPQRCGANV